MVAESEYHQYLLHYLAGQFPQATITEEVYTDSGRFCDIMVEHGPLRLAIEVENTAEDVVTNGVGQALLYSEELDAVPVVIYPDGDNEAELDSLRSFCHIVKIPYPTQYERTV